jgi:EmrB/QacA subfamily drug resistance transporter
VTRSPVKWNPTWTLIAASLALMMAFLDALVVTTALPSLRASLHSSLSELEWTVTAYNLTFACMLLTGAALGDRFGRRRMFCGGLSLFLAASALAGLAHSAGLLIAARAMQGAGAAVMVPLTLTLVLEAYPPARQNFAIGVWSGVAALSGACGPIVGGGVIQALDWHWIFWVNIPVGLAVLVVATLRFRESYGGHPRLDVVGLLLVTAAIFGITWGIVRTDTRALGSVDVLAPLAAGVVLLGVFVQWERRCAYSMVRLAMFRSAAFSAANAISFCLFAALFGALFLMSQFFQTAQGRSPLGTGAALLIWSAWGFFVAPTTGKLAGRFGNLPFLRAGLVLNAAGLVGIALVTRVHTGYLELAPLLALSGIGIAMVFPTVTAEAMGAVPPEDVGIASGTNNALRELGGVFGIAILATVFNRHGVYASPAAFVDGFRSALWVSVAFTVGAISLTAVLARRPARAPRPSIESEAPQPEFS